MAESPAQLHADIEKYERKHVENPGGRFFLPLASAYREAGDPARAEGLLREGLQRYPDYLSARVVLGQALLDAGETAVAGAEFRRVLSVDPQNVLALHGLAEVAEREDRLEEAARWYAELLAADPLDDRARQALARIEEREADRATGSESEPEVAPEEPEDELVSETLAELYARQGHTDRAVGMYRRLIRQRGAEPLLVRRLAELDPAPGPAADPDVPLTAAEPFAEPPAVDEPFGTGTVAAPLEVALEEEPVVAAAVEELTETETPTVGEYFEALLSWRPAAESPAEGTEGQDEADAADPEALGNDRGEEGEERVDEYAEPVPAWMRNR